MGELKQPDSMPAVKYRLVRCLDWLQKQNNQDSKKLLHQNKNDIQFIIDTNAERKKFLLEAAEDETTVPNGVCEPNLEPVAVPLSRLRCDGLHMECEWPSCKKFFTDYELFQTHVRQHIADIKLINEKDSVILMCLWDVCGHKTSDFDEMVRHILYHSYHAKLLAIGFNARATLNLLRCKKDSSKRNNLPRFTSDHSCLWTDCDMKFKSMQGLLDHVQQHINHSDSLCSWAGCGLRFHANSPLRTHMRTHTGERVVACYHCGAHFASNRKLTDHLRRQNVCANSPYKCSMCGIRCATEYLLNDHARQHVSAFACGLCDMSAQTSAALAQHIRYRHLDAVEARLHACPECEYRAVTKSDLRKHAITHTKKRLKRQKQDGSGSDVDSDDSSLKKKRKKSLKKYACHICTGNKMKVFSRGTRLTSHLVKVHGAQWPSGHCRFRYQISEDGMYRLTTTRYEVLEVSKQIVDGQSEPKEALNSSFEFDLKQVAEPTDTTPRRFEITLKNTPNKATVSEDATLKKEPKNEEDNVVITMCDVDDEGNIIRSEIVKSEVFFTPMF